MVRTALNAVTEDWETFVQSILGRASLPSWEEMWASLRQEEIKRLTKAGSSSKGIRVKKEKEEDAVSHQRDSKGSRRERKRTYPKSYASDVEKWVISPRSALGRRAKKTSLTQRLFQHKLTRRTLRIAP